MMNKREWWLICKRLEICSSNMDWEHSHKHNHKNILEETNLPMKRIRFPNQFDIRTLVNISNQRNTKSQKYYTNK